MNGRFNFIKDIENRDSYSYSDYDHNLYRELIILSEKQYNNIRLIQQKIKKIDGEYLPIV